MIESASQGVSGEKLLEELKRPKQYQFDVNDMLVGYDAALLFSELGPKALIALFPDPRKGIRLRAQIARERGLLTVNLRQIRADKVFEDSPGYSPDRFGTRPLTFEPRYPSGIIGDHTVMTITDDTRHLDLLRYCSFRIQSDLFTHFSLLSRVLSGKATQGTELNDLLEVQVLAHNTSS